jgi:hypothetical protein
MPRLSSNEGDMVGHTVPKILNQDPLHACIISLAVPANVEYRSKQPEEEPSAINTCSKNNYLDGFH